MRRATYVAVAKRGHRAGCVSPVAAARLSAFWIDAMEAFACGVDVLSGAADGSIKRSAAWLGISRAFAARLRRALAFCVLGACSVAMIDLQ